MTAESGNSKPRRVEHELRLEELPADVDEEMPLRVKASRANTGRPFLTWFGGIVVLLGLTVAAVHYLLPTQSGQVLQAAKALIQRAVGDRRTDAKSLTPQQAAAREAARKEAAWKDFFQRSPRCVIEDNQTSVECVNEYIRARRDFDHRWESGQL